MKSLVGLDPAELRQLAESLGQPAYRGTQVAKWIYEKGVRDLEAMTDLPKAFREALSQDHHTVPALTLVTSREAPDGTTKFLFRASDGREIESVWIPYPDRVTACISSQVGCAMRCSFCATGQLGFERNLTPGEIVDQILAMQSMLGRRISNVVYMGMGEPLLNLDHVLKSVRLLNQVVGIAMRQITISTVGIVPQMERLAQEKLQLTLALSLHAPNDALRDELVPVNTKFQLSSLRDAVREYEEITGRRVTLEYIMLGGVNDAPQHARELAAWAKGLHVHINLIPYHPTGADFRATPAPAIRQFAKSLEDAGFPTAIRAERGLEIEAACGQLKRQLAGAHPPA
ncbi:MAG: 23S rRNA (adenine(2503)-C(2))-methyltransferase RlmN [Candidatus Sericytochromatia bacterium]|nr:23S rRNA (adenine(2503)-C(2))-methyltransferase RlmN [Candidatus Sericytochromatia bacterium]